MERRLLESLRIIKHDQQLVKYENYSLIFGFSSLVQLALIYEVCVTDGSGFVAKVMLGRVHY